MSTTKHNTIILSVAAIVSVAIISFYGKKHHPKYDYHVFHAQKGWGYDILVDDRRIIHQEEIPVIPEARGFESREQAEKTASIIINKLEQNKLPTLTKFEIEQVYPERSNK
jgi:hypothetical protein